MSDVLAQLRALLAAEGVSRLPWTHAIAGEDGHEDDDHGIRQAGTRAPFRDVAQMLWFDDAALIVAAVNALPALLDVVEAAQRKREAQRAYTAACVGGKTQLEITLAHRAVFQADEAYNLALGSLDRAALGAPPAPGEGGRHDGGS